MCVCVCVCVCGCVCSVSRTQSRPSFLFLGVRFPYKVLQTKRGTLFLPRFLLGLGFFLGLFRHPTPQAKRLCGSGFWVSDFRDLPKH